jgi:diacylglycerol kinase family enzyme
MTGQLAGQVVRELGTSLDLRTAQTSYRGHARELAAAAAAQGHELVVTFGGDGTINEVVNGLMATPAISPPSGAGLTGTRSPTGNTGNVGPMDPSNLARPAIAPIPGGGGNVFARTLGIPLDPVAAARHIVAAATSDTRRAIGLSRAQAVVCQPDEPSQGEDRYFTFSAGLGLDAEVVADVDRARATGQRARQSLYMRTALRRYYTTDRSKPALTLHTPGRPEAPGLFMGVVTNSSPWTFVGNHPVLPVPHDGRDSYLNSGLDVFALRRLRTLTTLGALHQMLHANSNPPTGPDVISAQALARLTFSADRPIAFHIDGEFLGETEQVAFTFVPDALRVVA